MTSKAFYRYNHKIIQFNGGILLLFFGFCKYNIEFKKVAGVAGKSPTF